MALVTHIQRLSLYDGPGVRTTLFLAGCPLQCAWCHNPECRAYASALMVDKYRCCGCGACVSVCPVGAITMTEDGALTDRGKCINCGACSEECVFGARKMSATEMSVEQIVTQLMKDAVVFSYGGGVTVSGGEPLACPQTPDILKALKEKGIHTAMETSGYGTWEAVEATRPYTDLYLYDIKLADREKHRKYTGRDNTPIIENLKRLAGTGANIILRLPLIPGVNDDAEELTAIFTIAKNVGISEAHVLPFHQLGQSKYDQLAMDYRCRDLSEDNDEGVDRAKQICTALGLRCSIKGSGFSPKEQSL